MNLINQIITNNYSKELLYVIQMINFTKKQHMSQELKNVKMNVYVGAQEITKDVGMSTCVGHIGR